MPGVYFWKDENDFILYIGKAKKIRTRVKSYLSPNAKHSARILAMLKKAKKLEFILTPGDRDALVLESNLIKSHQPPYNVLLKDDESYPYICASIGDRYPRFSAVPRKYGKEIGEKASKYR
jgi:excinuclease ABC subunit C